MVEIDSLGSAPLREKSSNEEPRFVRVPVQMSQSKEKYTSIMFKRLLRQA